MAIDWTKDESCTQEHIQEYARLQALSIHADEYMKAKIAATADAVALIRQVDFNRSHRFEFEINRSTEWVRVTGAEYFGHGEYEESYLEFPLTYLYDWDTGKKLEEAKREERHQLILKLREESRIKKEAEYKAHRLKLYEELKKEFGQ